MYFLLVPCSVQTIQYTIKDFPKFLNLDGSTCINLVDETDLNHVHILRRQIVRVKSLINFYRCICDNYNSAC